MEKRKNNIYELVRANVLHMKPYSSARDEFKDFHKEMIFLDANENPNNNGVNRYPDPKQQRLKQLLADRKKVSVDEILLGNGSDEVLDLIFRVFCEPSRDEVITLPPTYGMYKVLCETNDVECVEVPLTTNFQLNVPEIIQAQTPNTKLLFICSPNNPSGNMMSDNSIIKLLEQFNGIVVIDEAYIDFTDRTSWVDRIGQYNNLIITQTLSKAYGMAGIRLGVCYASAEIIALLTKIKPPYNVNTLSQAYAIEGLMKESSVREQVQALVSERKRLVEALNHIPMVKKVFDSDANFVLIRVDDAEKRYHQLVERGIVVRNRSSQLHCENTLRITVGTLEENNLIIHTLKDL
ncbi:MAG: histidinol-phosphate transaminase [Aureisphaera sp.]